MSPKPQVYAPSADRQTAPADWWTVYAGPRIRHDNAWHVWRDRPVAARPGYFPEPDPALIGAPTGAFLSLASEVAR